MDVPFASAGTGEFAPIGEVAEGQFDRTFGLNVRGTLFTVQKALPLLADGGSIIMNGSIAGSMGFPAFGVYSASKAALRSFARTWTVDLKARNFRVDVLSPWTIDTPILDGVPKDAVDAFVALIPRGTMGRPEEIATAALFLNRQADRQGQPSSAHEPTRRTREPVPSRASCRSGSTPPGSRAWYQSRHHSKVLPCRSCRPQAFGG
jgi:NAD(P)-dependent dehydrogenase (short-subunit alcohol dehydrogenase family)